MLDQLMAFDKSRLHFATHSEYKQRPSYYQRQVKHGGRQCRPVIKNEPQEHAYGPLITSTEFGELEYAEE